MFFCYGYISHRWEYIIKIYIRSKNFYEISSRQYISLLFSISLTKRRHFKRHSHCSTLLQNLSCSDATPTPARERALQVYSFSACSSSDMFWEKNFFVFFFQNIPHFWVQEFLPRERGGVFLFLSFALFFGAFCGCVWLGWEVCYHLTTTLLYGEPRVSFFLKGTCIYFIPPNEPSDKHLGRFSPSSYENDRLNELESWLSILTKLSP